MTLMQLCALVPPMCRMAADPDVRRALATLSEDPEADPAPLAAAMARYPTDARRAMTLLGTGDPPTRESLRRRFSREALAFFHLCGQCAPEELLSVLTRCTVLPSAEAIALLVGERRREEASQHYALQLLWRLNGDPGLPDATRFFPERGAPARSPRSILNDLINRLKETPS